MKATSKAPAIRGLRLFDSCVTLGRVVRRGTTLSVTPDNVLKLLDKYDIVEALVHHNEARLHLPRIVGNRSLLDEIKGMRRLHPVWVLEPPSSPDPVAARDLVDEMLASGVRVARLMMGFAPPFHWLWEDLLEVLEEHRVPCFLDFGATGYDSGGGTTRGNPDAVMVHHLRDVCMAHPDLPMILSHVSGGLGLAYPVLPLMRRLGNLHLDVTSVVNYWRIAAAEIGPERVFFATGMPYYEAATFVSNAQYDPYLSLDAKRAICGDNLRHLLEAVA